MATDRVGQKQMVQIFPLFETYSNDYLFHLFPQVHIYKIVKNYIIMQSIQVSFLCVFCIRKYIKNGGINFGLSRLAIFVWLGILSIMVKHAVDLQWQVVTVSNQKESLVQSRNDTSIIFNAVNITGKKRNIIILKKIFFN